MNEFENNSPLEQFLGQDPCYCKGGVSVTHLVRGSAKRAGSTDGYLYVVTTTTSMETMCFYTINRCVSTYVRRFNISLLFIEIYTLTLEGRCFPNMGAAIHDGSVFHMDNS